MTRDTDMVINRMDAPLPAERPVEMVERKGLGHPDTVCDALAETLSLALSRAYLERFGVILHHNVDKALLWGGVTQPAFGGGCVIEPMEIFLAGRVTRCAEGVDIPVDEIARAACEHWLREHFHALDPGRHVKIHCLLRPGSSELVELFLRQRQNAAPLANDTSCGVGFAPLDELETLVLESEHLLNAPETKAQAPELGEDVKLMGVRRGDSLSLTVACAFIDRYVRDMDDYRAKKAGVAERLRGLAARLSRKPVVIEVNTADNEAGENIYLTVTGTSGEAGDDGEVGRGNRVNGLITPYRPMTVEAAAGKNPVSHVGKLYQVGANRLARRLVADLAEVQAAECYLVSRIGSPVDTPQITEIGVRTREDVPLSSVRDRIEEIARAELGRLGSLWRELVEHGAPVY